MMSTLMQRLVRRQPRLGGRRSLHMTSTPRAQTDPVTSPLTKQATEIQIPVPWGHLSAKWWGRKDVQPVLMLHGWQDNAGTFDALAPLLDNEALLAVDMAGHGRSSHYPIGRCYNFLDGVINIRRIVDHFRWTRFSVIGHSFGSLLAYAYAASFPEAVDKLVTVEDVRGALFYHLVPTVEETRRQVAGNLACEAKMTRAGGEQRTYAYDEVVDVFWKSPPDYMTRESARVILRRGLVETRDSSGEKRYRFSRDPRLKVFSWCGLTEADMLAYAAAITCDSLHILGGRSQTGQPEAKAIYEKTVAIMAQRARCEYHVVDGQHHVHLNEPGLVAPLINQFFKTNK